MRIVRPPKEDWLVLFPTKEKRFFLQPLALSCGYRICELCAELGCSQRYLYEVFMRDVGLAPKEWMRHERMAVAQQKLERGSPPDRVAEELGFSNSNSFRREFSAFHGMPPVRFQKNQTMRGSISPRISAPNPLPSAAAANRANR